MLLIHLIPSFRQTACIVTFLVATLGVNANTVCVDSAISLQQALVTVQGNTQANEIRVVAGSYDVSSSNLSMATAAAGDLTIVGGWSPGCAGSVSKDASDTELVGMNTMNFSLRGLQRLEMRALSFTKFGLIAMRRDGSEGGHAIEWDGIKIVQAVKIEVSSTTPGPIDLRNLLVYDSGLGLADCMFSIAQDVTDTFAGTLLAQSTFAMNQGNKQVCIQGAEPKLLRNNIFDGPGAQQSVFVATAAATLQHNRVQMLGGLPPSAESVDNFTNAPGFVNAPMRDFRLVAASPAINRGRMVLPGGQRAFDLFGNTRWTGFRPDLGAIESNIVESSVFLVTNSDDSGSGSLRQAVENANADDGPSIIQFAIADGCNTRIVLNSELPMLQSPLWVDGYSQPGSSRNTSDTSFNANICVGVVAGGFGFAHAFRTQTGGAPMRIEGIGFGGFGAASGNNAALAIGEARDSVVRGNQFGSSSGLGQLPANNTDASISGVAMDVQVGGPSLSERNLFTRAISGANITIGGVTRNIEILGNWFGLERNGTEEMSSSNAVVVEGANTLIHHNRFAYCDSGVVLSSSLSQHNRVQRNLFGRDAAGNSAPVKTAVTAIGGSNNVIGAVGDQSVGGNVIDFSGGPAINIFSIASSTSLGIRTRTNLIHGTTTGMAIDLEALGPTANDAGDLDEGSNRQMNHPVWALVSDGSGVITALGSIDTLEGSVVIDVYASATSGGARGQGQHYLGRVTTSTGIFQVQFPLTSANPYPYLSATATSSDGNTSEMSPSLRPASLFGGSFE